MRHQRYPRWALLHRTHRKTHPKSAQSVADLGMAQLSVTNREAMPSPTSRCHLKLQVIDWLMVLTPPSCLLCVFAIVYSCTRYDPVVHLIMPICGPFERPMFVQGYGRHANTGTGTVLVSCVSRLPPVSLNWYVVQVRCRVVVVFCERASPLRVCRVPGRVCLAATGCVCYRIERYAVLSRSIDLQLCHELSDSKVRCTT
jgi:hypothetical protein